ncbi:TRIC cation channel family protein [Streptomyces sp. DSM 41524]|uniref:TRIC cation channel family protein n=1 Tax=Streptomyces asiaticus subsp. ignotus TaxID=3098222 RepID=A0ABU7Q6Q3_9ACTN|nr:TRIC cation channel family protein [Streptomyces sp. DSM 41524]
MHQLTTFVQYPLDLVGIFAFALSGATLAVRMDFNLFGTALLAEVTGLGGGLFRDLVLGVTPIAFTDLRYALAPLVAAVLVFFSVTAQRHETVCEVLDAGALGLFSVTGTIKALDHGFGLLPAAALGVATAAGGGAFSSVLAREIPPVLRWDADLYALPAVAGAGGVAALHHGGALTGATATAAATFAFVLRVLAFHYHWRGPQSRVWRRKRAARPSAPEQPAMAQHTSAPLRYPSSPGPQPSSSSSHVRFPGPATHGQAPERGRKTSGHSETTLQLRLPRHTRR